MSLPNSNTTVDLSSVGTTVKRRRLLRAAATTAVPFAFATPAQARRSEVDDDTEEVARNYFDDLRKFENEKQRERAAIGCANKLCRRTKAVPEEVVTEIVDGVESGEVALRRGRRAVEILNEQRITTAIEPSALKKIERKGGQYLKYVPIIESFNNLRSAACQVSPDNKESIKNFYIAALAFGLEVVLWQISAPYKIAWRSTRYVSNRTFLRYARHGCDRCIALAMSELHWALRRGIYGDVVEENKIEFVIGKLHELQEDARKYDYDVDIQADREAVESVLSEENKGGGGAIFGQRADSGFLDGILRKLPELPELPFLAAILGIFALFFEQS